MQKIICPFIILFIITIFHQTLLFGQDSLQQKIVLKGNHLDAARIKSPKRILPFALSYKTFPQTQLNNAQNSLMTIPRCSWFICPKYTKLCSRSSPVYSWLWCSIRIWNSRNSIDCGWYS